MRKFECVRCGVSVNVISGFYVNDGGDLYCDTFCHKHKHIPLDLSKKTNVKTVKKKKPTYLVIIEDRESYHPAVTEIGYTHKHMTVEYVTLFTLNNNKENLVEEFKDKRIVETVMFGDLELNEKEQSFLNRLIRYTKGKIDASF